MLSLLNDNLLFSEMLITPTKRCQGIGAAVIRELLENSEIILGVTIKHAEACIFPSNVPSQKAFGKAGFQADITDPEGYTWRYTVPHQMNLVPSAFQKIANGTKTIELRLNDPKRQAVGVGDHIVFHNTETDEHLEVEVCARHEFTSFEELYAALPLLKCGYSENELVNASPTDMYVYYTDEQIALHGVVGIEVKHSACS